MRLRWEDASPAERARVVALRAAQHADPETRSVENALQWFHRRLRDNAAQRERFAAYRHRQRQPEAA